MLPERKLTLRRERLAALEPADLAGVAGGTHEGSQCVCPTRMCLTLQNDDCLTQYVTPLIGHSLPC